MNNPLLKLFSELGVSIKIFELHWKEIHRIETLPQEVISIIKECTVVQGDYGPSVHITGKGFHFYLGVSDYSTLEVGEIINPEDLSLIILEKDSKRIIRVIRKGDSK